MKFSKLKKALVYLGALVFLVHQAFAAEEQGEHWVATWGASPFEFIAFGPGAAPQAFENQTLRQKLRISAGGKQVQIRFSNELGNSPLTIGSASVALAGEDSAIQVASLQQLTFGGQTGISIPAGAPALSDPLVMHLDDLAELAVSIYLPEQSLPTTMHMDRTTYVSSSGDFSTAATLPDAELNPSHFFLTSVLVLSEEDIPVVAAFGDSITDGTASTPQSYNSWPDLLAARVFANDESELSGIAIVNGGISGNQLLSDGAGVNAQARFDRDVLSIPGLSHIVVLEGINDIGLGGLAFPGGTPGEARTAQELIAAYRQLIARAHAKDLKIIGATLLPFQGAQGGYYTPEKDAVRMQVNTWIRNSDEFDAVIDFEAAVRDPQNPNMMLQEFNSGDNLHPGDVGYRQMADSIDLNIFK